MTVIDSDCHLDGKEFATARAIDSHVQAWGASIGLLSPEMTAARADVAEGFALGERLK